MARWGGNDNDFIDTQPCPLVVLDPKGKEFIEKGKEAFFCTNIFAEYENQGLLSEEEIK